MKNFLLDKDFLRELDQFQHKEIYAKIIALNFNEMPIEEVQGRVTGGSINIDGASSLRRSCNLTLVAEAIDINNFYWCFNNKFKLEIGVKNFINKDYPDIIWFNQGVFLINSFNTTYNTNSYQISISGQDKMCLVNGNVGGNLPSSIDFGQIENYDTILEEVTFSDKTEYIANKYYILNPNYSPTNGEQQYILSLGEFDKNKKYYLKMPTSKLEKIKLYQVIREAVHTYANEPYHNIIINDLQDFGLELLEYRGDEPIYFFFSAGICENISYNGDMLVYNKKWKTPKKLSELKTDNSEIDNLVEGFRNNTLKVTLGEEEDALEYTVAKIEYGQTAGYRITDLIYAGDLISSVGETLGSVLDKIVAMLGDFEYFYNTDGQFVFQKKRTYVNSSWSSLIKTDDKDVYAENAAYTSDVVYSFEDTNLITSFQNSPQLNNVKNDFSVWGIRKSISGKDIPIHVRYSLDKKPYYYKNYDGQIFLSGDEERLNELRYIKKEQFVKDINDRLQNFYPKYKVPDGLEQPHKKADGSWTPGWWDIRDWHDYYFALRQEEPDKTMKWYSRNDRDGCVKISSSWPELSERYPVEYCWLIIISPNGTINFQHGSSPITASGRECTQYYSYFNEQGYLSTVKVVPNVKKYFMPPYSGCSDSHTYLEFLEEDIKKRKNSVYFYNPDFPEAVSFEKVVEMQLDREFDLWLEREKIKIVDYREIIYQMALDYFKHSQEDDFLINVRNNNIIQDKYIYENGITGYEKYYTDLEGFWRQLYDIEPEVRRKTIGGYYEDTKQLLDPDKPEGEYKIVKKWIDFSLDNTDFSCDYFLPEEYLTLEEYTCLTENQSGKFSDDYAFWNKNVVEAPELLNFWLEIVEDFGELDQYQISNIGDRSKAINDNNITAIYFRETPNIIFTSYQDYDPYNIQTGYVYIWLQDYLANSFSISGRGKSAKDQIDELLYKHTYATQSITLNTIPIYYLEPNTRIHVYDEKSNINGDYIISQLSVPLTYNGTMSITATKAVERLY